MYQILEAAAEEEEVEAMDSKSMVDEDDDAIEDKRAKEDPKIRTWKTKTRK